MRNISIIKSNKGTSMVLFALMLTLLLSLAAIVFDIGNVIIEKQKLQTTADAASLAAAQELPDISTAKTVANRYIELNELNPSDFTITFSDNNSTINISGNKIVNYFFAKVLGFTSTSVSTQSAASIGRIEAAFKYTLFSGSTQNNLILNGSNQYIGGSSHTNRSFIANGSDITITDACEAVSTITTNGSNINISHRLPFASYVEMPDFSDLIKKQAEQAGQLYNVNKTFNGSYIDVDSPIYVDGNVTVNGSHFRGKGTIIATGSITFNGSNLNESSDDAICFYSKSGNITVNGSNAVFDGILYAPQGSITMNGSNQTVHGRVIANTAIFNGSGLEIIGGTTELMSLPSSGVKLVK